MIDDPRRVRANDTRANDIAEEYDVVILGGGLASLCLARLLNLEVPAATVLTVDPSAGPSRKVGESTVEVGAHFLHTRLQLADLLCQTQLPKNGLRYWFDDEDHSLSFRDASEDGPATFAYWRTYQLERESLENSLLDLNREAGITHLHGTRDIHPTLATDDRHGLTFRQDGERYQIRGRWLIDATGPKAVLGKKCDNLVADERLTHSACWAWFRGAHAPDEFLEGCGPQRAFSGPRVLSTNHLFNEGYWIWLIPLASGLLSVGLVYDDTVLENPPQNLEEYERFLRGHEMARQVLEGAEAVDFGAARKYSVRPRHYLDERRIAWIGVAGGFVDPLYSNGIDIIAYQCEYVSDLIRRDLAEEPIRERLEAYDAMLLTIYELAVLYFQGIYKTLCSQELSVPRYRRDLHLYWNLWAWPFISGKLLDLDFLAEFRGLGAEALERGAFQKRLLLDAYEHLRKTGNLRRRNRGCYTFNPLGYRIFPYLRFERQMGNAPDVGRCRTALHEIDTGTFLAMLDILFDGEGSPLRRPLFDAVSEVYDDIRELEAAAGGFTEKFWALTFERMSSALARQLAQRGIESTALAISEQNYGRLREELQATCHSPADLELLNDYFAEHPDLQDFEDLPANRDQAQPLDRWTAEHSPWLNSVPDFRTVYEVLGPAWWRRPKNPMARMLSKE